MQIHDKSKQDKNMATQPPIPHSFYFIILSIEIPNT